MIDNLHANEQVTYTGNHQERYRIAGGHLVKETADIENIVTGEMILNVGWSTLTYTGDAVPDIVMNNTIPITSVELNAHGQYVCANCKAVIEEIHVAGEKHVVATVGYDTCGITEDYDDRQITESEYEGNVTCSCPICEAVMHMVDETIVEKILSHNNGDEQYPDLRGESCKA